MLINGKNYDWANITCVLFGIPVVGITDISWKVDNVNVNNYGAGREPVSYGQGNKSYGGSMTLYKEEVNAIVNASPNKDISNIPPFSIIIQYSGDGVNYTTEEILNIRLLSEDFKAKQNDTSLMMTVPFIFAGIKR
jgi:hypothetical protein